PQETFWDSSNETQKLYLNILTDVELHELETASGLGSEGLKVVNNFMIEKGMFDCVLPGPVNPDSIVAGVYLKILSQWLVEGYKLYKNLEITKNPTAFTKTGESVLLENQPYAFAQIEGQIQEDYLTRQKYATASLNNSDIVIFESISEEADSELVIEANGFRLASQLGSDKYFAFDGLQFPHVDLNINRNLVEIEGVHATNSNYIVTTVLGQCKLKVNHIGVELELAASGLCESTSIKLPKYLAFTDTFTMHFVRKQKVYASVLITKEDFKEVEINFENSNSIKAQTTFEEDDCYVNPNLERKIT
ncbi:MAG: hypothetical protein ACRCXZ_01410, partial [Patescibacteria group bacterium]